MREKRRRNSAGTKGAGGSFVAGYLVPDVAEPLSSCLQSDSRNCFRPDPGESCRGQCSKNVQQCRKNSRAWLAQVVPFYDADSAGRVGIWFENVESIGDIGEY